VPGLTEDEVMSNLQTVSYGHSYTYTGNASYTLKLSSVIPNPQVSGSAPSAGMEYLEVDVAVTNNGTVWTYPPRDTMYYLLSTGKEIDTLDDAGSNSNVSIPGKQSMTDLNYVAINPNQTLVFYLLYEIPKASNGKVVLNQNIGSTSDSNPAVAIFNLN
jgi:hypothetical protein